MTFRSHLLKTGFFLRPFFSARISGYFYACYIFISCIEVDSFWIVQPTLQEKKDSLCFCACNHGHNSTKFDGAILHLLQRNWPHVYNQKSLIFSFCSFRSYSIIFRIQSYINRKEYCLFVINSSSSIKKPNQTTSVYS